MSRPGVRVISGPPQAGLGVGDVLCVDPETWLFLSSIYRRKAMYPSIHWLRNGITNGGAWRYHEREWQELFYTPNKEWKTAQQKTQKCGPWMVELVDDVGLLGTTRRFTRSTPAGDIEHLLTRPIFTGHVKGEVFSRWTGVSEARDGEVEVSDCYVWEIGGDPDDASKPCRSLDVVVFPRARGVSMWDLEMFERGKLDPSIAHGIVHQLLHEPEKKKAPVVCFDGVVRRYPSLDGPGVSYGDIEPLYQRLCGVPWTSAPPAASLDEVGAFVRSLAPDDWATEQAVREECGVLLAAETAGFKT